jgi:hypothetical protein
LEGGLRVKLGFLIKPVGHWREEINKTGGEIKLATRSQQIKETLGQLVRKLYHFPRLAWSRVVFFLSCITAACAIAQVD